MYDNEDVSGEPTLDDLLVEPIIRLVMARDHVHADEIRTMADVAKSRGNQSTRWSSGKDESGIVQDHANHGRGRQ